MKIKLKKNNFPKGTGEYILQRFAVNGDYLPREVVYIWKDDKGLGFDFGIANHYRLNEIRENSLWSDRIDFV